MMQRRCNACRNGKVQCGRQRPSCTRCARRAIACVYPENTQFVFRDQNEVAAANVRRARNQLPRAPTFTFEVGPPQTLSNEPAPDSESQPLPDPESEPLPSPSESFHHNPTPWLNDAAARIVPPLLYTVDDKAVLRFFSKWVLHPCNHDICPGYFHELPAMLSSEKANSVLRLAVEAAANAEVATIDRQGTYYIRSKEKYGAALSRIRQALRSPEIASDDSFLAAILVIDTYELMYTGRNEPLGPHTSALISLLRLRGLQQLFTARGMSLWRLAHHRLQARQLLLEEAPMTESTQWVGMLNQDRPDLYIAQGVLRVNLLNIQAKTLLQADSQDIDTIENTITEVEELDHASMSFLDELDVAWKPWTVPTKYSAVMDVFPIKIRPTVLLYHDVWTARTWNYHRACSIKLHQMLIDLKVKAGELRSMQEARLVQPNLQEDLQSHQSSINRTSEEILSTVPMLLGVIDSQGQCRDHEPMAKEVGLLFLLLPMWVIRRCQYTSRENKFEAQAVLDFLNSRSDQ